MALDRYCVRETKSRQSRPGIWISDSRPHALVASLYFVEMNMATTPDNLPIGQTHASRPSKTIILILVGVVIGFFALTLSHDPSKENAQSTATSAAPSRE
jgi:hypothetical membrane protein